VREQQAKSINTYICPKTHTCKLVFCLNLTTPLFRVTPRKAFPKTKILGTAVLIGCAALLLTSGVAANAPKILACQKIFFHKINSGLKILHLGKFKC